MRMFRDVAAAVLVLVLGSPSAFAQQRHVVDSASLADSVRQHSAAQDADREMIRATLAQPAVQRAAAAAGIDLARVSAGVNTMSAADLSRTATAARDVTQSLAASSLAGGASSVTISTTTIIIALLLVILIIVALD